MYICVYVYAPNYINNTLYINIVSVVSDSIKHIDISSFKAETQAETEQFFVFPLFPL